MSELDEARAHGWKIQTGNVISPDAPKATEEILKDISPEQEIRYFFSRYLSSGEVVEIRAFGKRGIYSGYFDNIDALVKAASALDAASDIEGIYFTENLIDPSLIARRMNRTELLPKNGTTTSDGNVLRYKVLDIDIDADRAAKISSTDEEKAAALHRSREIREFLTTLGFPAPVETDSGNGARLLYRVDVDVSPDTTQLIKNCIQILHDQFPGGAAHVDLTTFNPSRITKVPGTVARKGDNHPVRPHRRSHVLSFPDPYVSVPRDLLEKLAGKAELPLMSGEGSKLPKLPTPKASGSFDLKNWMEIHRVKIGEYREIPKPKWRYFFLLEQCPFSTAHTEGAFVGQLEDGRISARCKHDSCQAPDGGNRWHDLRDLAEPGWQETRAAKGKPGEDIDYYAIAMELKIRHHAVSFNEKLWVYEDGVYTENMGFLKSEIQHILLERGLDKTDSLTEATRQIMAHMIADSPFKEYPFNASPDVIPVANGLLKLDFNTGDHTILPFTPEYKFTYKLRVKYDPKAEETLIQEYLDSLKVTNPILVKIPAHVICAMLGRKYKLAYLLQGKRDSGKSTYMNLLNVYLFGIDNCSNVSLHDIIYKQFRLAQLVGKCANIYADLSDRKIDETGTFKALTGGDRVTMEEKMQRPFQYENRAVMIFSCNEYPNISDTSDEAFWSRWDQTQFTSSFPINERFEEKTFTEANVSGFLNIVLRSVKIYLNEGISRNSDMEGLKEKWLRSSDTVYDFIKARLERDPEGYIEKQNLYRRYCKYCDKIDKTPEESHSVTKAMKRNRAIETQHRFTEKGKEVRCFKGYRILEEETQDDYDEMQPGQTGPCWKCRSGDVLYIRKGINAGLLCGPCYEKLD